MQCPDPNSESKPGVASSGSGSGSGSSSTSNWVDERSIPCPPDGIRGDDGYCMCPFPPPDEDARGTEPCGIYS